MPHFGLWRESNGASIGKIDDDSSGKSDTGNSDFDYSDDEDDEEGSSSSSSSSSSPQHLYSSSPTRYIIDQNATARCLAPYSYNQYHTDLYPKGGAIAWQEHQRYPPLSSHLDSNTAPTCALRRLSLVATLQRRIERRTAGTSTGDANAVNVDDDSDMLRLTQMLQGAAISGISTAVDSRTRKDASLRRQQQRQQPLRSRSSSTVDVGKTYRQLRQDHLDAAAALRQLLRSQEEQASKILAAEKAQEQKQQEAAQEQELLERAAQLEAEAAAQEAEAAQREADDKAKQREKEVAAEKAAAAAAASAVPEHVAKANKFRLQLVQVQQSVAIFDTSSLVAKRRLAMKKIVNGKVNTLAENVDKIRSVAAEVAQAIETARQDDTSAKEQYKDVEPPAPPELVLGKRYLVNLLAAKVMVRVQAEGFNGQRGDGFPLAHMLALISVDVKDFANVLTAHIYTVCPTAIPTLPKAGSDGDSSLSEDELMESLGMLRGKDGEFESFERFLSRTEGVISLVANIMASQPSNHSLLGGHEGAVKWLNRFLDLLPSAPHAPLPLITAPVLDAFLTGAGHMLSNHHASEFRSCLDSIANDVSTRLDESPVGMPSATRLRKTIRDGFDGFKKNLPSRALPELYYGANPGVLESSVLSSNAHAKKASPFGESSAAVDRAASSPFGRPPLPNQQQPSNPFGTNPSNPFSDGMAVKSPFGGGATASSSPFGTAAPVQSPFTGSSFGGEQQQQATPFASLGPKPAASPFSASAPNPSPFGTTPNQAISTPFGAQNSSSPFGGPSATTTPFGVQPAGPTGPTPAPSLFGSSAQNSSPFPPAPGLTSSSSPFGTTPNSSISPFGNPSQNPNFGSQTQTTPFGAQQKSSPFGAQQSNPFGSQQQSTAFGQPSPFGSNATPFGTQPTSLAAPPPSTPFGSTSFGSQQQQSTPFGSSQHTSPFGIQQPSTPFGAGQVSTPFGASAQKPSNFGGSRPPCKFFAQGRCRNGDSCTFSHETPQAPNNSFGNPFGGPRR